MDTTRNLKHKFGVFPHDVSDRGWYRAANAVAWYVSENAANRYANKNIHRNLVVRPLDCVKFY